MFHCSVAAEAGVHTPPAADGDGMPPLEPINDDYHDLPVLEMEEELTTTTTSHVLNYYEDVQLASALSASEQVR